VQLTTLKVTGGDAIRVLNEHRSLYASTGLYPFLIGDTEELERVTEAADFNKQEPTVIIRRSSKVDTAEWVRRRRQETEEYGFSAEELLGDWPGEVAAKGSISLHKDVLSRKIKPEVYLGLAQIEEPWQLPAIVKYGAWNECPEPEVHCAFLRQWQERFGAEITGMSRDVIECAVRRPPTEREAAIALAWDQYWYCADIVEQGCESISNLAATLLGSPYWYFWWD
jgi:hypothetical protein